MDDDLPAKKVFFRNPSITRRRGRQKTRWVDLVNRDTEQLAIPSWGRTANSRTEWSRIIRLEESA